MSNSGGLEFLNIILFGFVIDPKTPSKVPAGSLGTLISFIITYIGGRGLMETQHIISHIIARRGGRRGKGSVSTADPQSWSLLRPDIETSVTGNSCQVKILVKVLYL